VTPLSKLNEVSLLEEEKLAFGDCNLDPHPNHNRNNIYQPQASLYIKAYMRVLSEQIYLRTSQSHLPEVDHILKLLKILETYPYPNDHTKVLLFASLGKIHKQAFLGHLRAMMLGSRENYLQQVRQPFEDLPLNSSLVLLPAYSEFLAQSRPLLEKAKTYFKNSLAFVEGSVLYFERNLSAENIAWEYADNQCLLAEYVGRDKPKFVPEEQAALNPDELRLQTMNDILEAFGFIDFAIRIRSIKTELERNYMEIGAKGLDPSARIDEDINSEILEMDRQSKRGYPQFLLDGAKGKAAVGGADLITYMLKAAREAEFMTFGNPGYQNTIYKCNRLLARFLPGYKEKCQLGSLDVPLRKTLKDKFIDDETIIIKSASEDCEETFLYVVAPLK
jgi:hypothetical protein